MRVSAVSQIKNKFNYSNNIPKTNTSQQLETIEGDQSPKERLTTTIQHIANTLIGIRVR